MKQLSLRKGFAFAAALLLVGAAIAVAVATHGSGTTIARTDLTRLAKVGDPDATAKFTPGEGPDVGRPAAEEWAHKAYPASDIPFRAQATALNSFQRLSAKHQASLPPNAVRGQSVDVGRSSRRQRGGVPGRPDFLRRGLHRLRAGPRRLPSAALFRGRLHAVRRAAGGGIWRTTNALGAPGTQNWQFISGSFGSNAIGVMSWEPDKKLYVGTGEPHRRATPRPVSASGSPPTAATRGRTSRR